MLKTQGISFFVHNLKFLGILASVARFKSYLIFYNPDKKIQKDTKDIL